MAVLIAGAGAIGGTTAAVLAREDVVLVDPWYENVEAIRRHGLAVTIDGERRAVRARALYPDELRGTYDIVMLACKSYDTAWTVRALEPHLAPGGVIVSLQNGINEDLIAALVGAERTVGCVVHYNAEMPEPGHAVRFSPSRWRSYTVSRNEAVAALLGAETTDDIFGALWAKLAVNCMINALTAACGLDTAELWSSPVGRSLMLMLGAEAAAVARAQGREMQPIHLIATGTDMPAELLLSGKAEEAMAAEGEARLAASTRGRRMRTSMLQDIGKRRRPEIDHLNGYVVREGTRLGVATPANAAVGDLLRAVAAGDRPQDRAHLERVLSGLR
jgi:2-dehydropantoate 2-reductase